VNDNYMPTPDELNDAPELAVLAALDSTLEAATRALLAAYPELCEDGIPRYRLQPVICGARLLSRAIKLQVALVRYRQAVLRERLVDSDATDDLEALSADAF
jgi:hypothetical protein